METVSIKSEAAKSTRRPIETLLRKNPNEGQVNTTSEI